MKLGDLFPSRLTMAAGIGCAIFIPLAVTASYQWGQTHRDKVREEQRADGLDDDINAPGVGYKDRLTLCVSNLAGAQKAMETQNKAVDELRAAGDAAKGRAQAAVDAAQARAAAAQQRAQSLLSEQPRPGETRCEAADRLILEQVR
ncbi:hypothetical protein [Brevundimonas sp.]|uniref:hypothetical protein n=1 Tax=Brevundimonas sp. TaxID=1871086 RepID=UPI0025C34246|nr:hypothetical protein [Brevundimonas sp.]MCG2665043.1 hypothetical protein [Brevundimonas sp.]